MFWDSFLCERQCDEMFDDNTYWQYAEEQYINEMHEEIIPEEYEDWLRFCAGAYEASEMEGKSDI